MACRTKTLVALLIGILHVLPIVVCFQLPTSANNHKIMTPRQNLIRTSMAKKDTPPQGGDPSSSKVDMALQKVGKTTSAVVAGTFYAVLAYQRDALMVSFFIGAISNGILSKVLKKILKQERPEDLYTSEIDLPPSDNGMPSSHAMSLGFICTFTALQLPWTTLPLILYAIISLVYRVKSNLHTTKQVLVGVTIGSLNGYLWRSLCLGTNMWGVNVMNWVSTNLLNEQGHLPLYALIVPTLIGAAVVGSVERRISRFLKNRTKEE